MLQACNTTSFLLPLLVCFLLPCLHDNMQTSPQALVAPGRDFNSYLSLGAENQVPGQMAEYCKHFNMQMVGEICC